MDTFLHILRQIKQILWGKPYFRYSALLLTIGAGLVAGPDFWTIILTNLVQIFAIIYNAETPESKIELGAGDSIAPLIIGVLLILASVAVFIIFYLEDQRAAKRQGTSIFGLKNLEDMRYLRALWLGARDLNEPNADPNLDDVSTALFRVNESARLVLSSAYLEKHFSEPFGDDYCALYLKLKEFKYELPQYAETTDKLIIRSAHKFAEKMECKK